MRLALVLCVLALVCVVSSFGPPGAAALETLCSNGVDDDGDGFVDCDEVECACAATVHLRSTCSPDVPVCWTFAPTDVEDLMDWIWLQRRPTKDAPLLVDIGPGIVNATALNIPIQVPGSSQVIVPDPNLGNACDDSNPRPLIYCPNGAGHVTFRGAGRAATTLRNGGTWSGGLSGAVVYANACESLAFADLRIESVATGVWWEGAGSSTWTDVDVLGGVFGWYDVRGSDWSLGGPHLDDPAAPRGIHHWYSSSIEGAEYTGDAEVAMVPPQTAYFGLTSDAWFFGGRIQGRDGAAGVSLRSTFAGQGLDCGTPQVLHGSALRTYGSLVASDSVAVSVAGDPNMSAAEQAQFHGHGGIIRAAGDASVVALKVSDGGLAHTPDTAFILLPGSAGTATRLVDAGGGVLRSPFQWPADTVPPRSPSGQDLVSLSGQDTYVETDCDDVACLGGDEPHTMVYRAACSAGGGPWWDLTLGACRAPAD